jgi:putative ABC transport system permease protein
MSNRHAPRLARRLLEALLPEESRDAVIGDLTERWEQDMAARPRGARLRFWRETLHAIATLQTAPAEVSAWVPATRESLVQSFLSDLRHAIRAMVRSPGFAILGVGTLAVAIAATATLVSVANPLLFQVVPYPAPQRLVMVHERALDGAFFNVGYATYVDLRNATRSLRHSAAYGTWEPTLFGEQEGERLRGLRVTWEFFRTLGVQPAIGRDFLRDEDTPDRYDVVILSHGLWQRRFAGDTAIIGRAIDLATSRPIVIGVLPADFENVLDPTSQIYRALGYDTQESACRSCRHLRMIGRLESGVSHEQSALELDALMQRLASQHAATYRGSAGAVVERMADRATRGTRAIFAVTIGAVALLLLIAAANVVNLHLARAARREEEFAVRAALGAGRGRIARQLFAEGLVIAVAAGVVAVMIAALALPTLVSLLPETLPRVTSVRLDGVVLAVTAIVVVVVAIAIGMIPALHAGKRSLFSAIRAGGGRAGGAPHHRTRSGIVVAQVALAMMLVVGAALLGRSLARLLSVDLGFEVSNLVTMTVQATGPRYDSARTIYDHHDRMRDAVLRVPGVTAVGLTSQLPLGGNMDRYGIRDRDNLPTNPDHGADGERYAVSWDYMRAMRIRMVRGRAFTEDEARDTASRTAIVSDALARRMWPGQDALGKYIRIGGGDDRPFHRVIGIAADTRHAGLDQGALPQVYVPERHWVWPENTMVLVARVTGDPAHFIDDVREAVRSVDPLQPVSRIATMEQVVARSIGQRRLGMLLFVTFGAIALLLAAAGIYGVLAGAVAERTREFGVRAAFGATPAAIIGLVLRQGGALAVIGLALGGAGAALLSHYLRALLYEVEARDPVSIGVGAVAIGLVALAACVVPARRATRADPVSALRAD